MKKGLLALVSLALASVAGAKEAQFRFAPADGLECDQHIRRETIREAGIGGPEQTTVAEGVTHVVNRRTEAGYEITAIIRSARMTVNGKQVDDPFTKVMIGKPVVYDVRPDGSLRDIRGYEALMEDVRKSFPEEIQETMLKVFRPEMLHAREEAEWNGRVTSFISKTVKVGDVWEGVEDFPLPSGAIRFTSLTAFPKIEERGERTMVTVRFAYEADPTAARALLTDVLKSVMPVSAGPAPRIGETSLRGGGERIVDARTMNMPSERVWRDIHFPVEVRGVGTAMAVRHDRTEYRNECAGDPPR
jgi:hypothetical protein